MADSSLMPALIGLGGTVIGFAGGLITQWLLEGKKQQAEKRRKRAEKLEELIAILYEYSDCIKNEIETNHPDLSVRLEAVQRVYFPEFRHLTENLKESLIGYVVIKKVPLKVLKKEQPDIASDLTPTQLEEVIEKSELRYFHAFNSYLDEIDNYAKREFQ